MSALYLIIAVAVGYLLREFVPKWFDAFFNEQRDRRLSSLDRKSKHYERRVERIDEVWHRLHEANKAGETMLPPLQVPNPEDVKNFRSASQAYRDCIFENSRYFTQTELNLLHEFDTCLRAVEQHRQAAKIYTGTDIKLSVSELTKAREILDGELHDSRQRIDAEFRKANPPDA